MAVQIKIFEDAQQQDTPNQFIAIETRMNEFLLTLNTQKVLAIDYKYLLVGNTKRPGITRCTGYIIYET
jgi:hypothetical protein